MKLDLGGDRQGLRLARGREDLEARRGSPARSSPAPATSSRATRRRGSEGWRVGVAPLESPGSGKVRAVPLAQERGVSTSGDAERFVEIGGVRYSHVVDPKTGIGKTGRSSVSVIAPRRGHGRCPGYRGVGPGARAGVAADRRVPGGRDDDDVERWGGREAGGVAGVQGLAGAGVGETGRGAGRVRGRGRGELRRLKKVTKPPEAAHNLHARVRSAPGPRVQTPTKRTQSARGPCDVVGLQGSRGRLQWRG